jgi:hypothetical protein
MVMLTTWKLFSEVELSNYKKQESKDTKQLVSLLYQLPLPQVHVTVFSDLYMALTKFHIVPPFFEKIMCVIMLKIMMMV